MTLDQKNQIWVAVGTWQPLAAVIIALYLAKRVEKVRLNVQVSLLQVVIGGARACRHKRHEFVRAARYGQHGWLGYRQRQKTEVRNSALE